MERCLVLNVKIFDFEAEEGRRIKGCNMTYVTGVPEASQNRRGLTPMTVPISDELYEMMQSVPGVWEVQFSQRPGRGGKPTLTATRAKYCDDSKSIEALLLS